MALAKQNSEAAKRIALRVKQTARSIVSSRTTNSAAAVEEAAASGDFDTALRSLADLAAAFEELPRASKDSFAIKLPD